MGHSRTSWEVGFALQQVVRVTWRSRHRLQVKGAADSEIQLRYGEMLHPDGGLMTENLRRARATDTYVLRGDPDREDWTPRFREAMGKDATEAAQIGLVGAIVAIDE